MPFKSPEAKRAWREANRERGRELKREHYARHRERLLAEDRERRQRAAALRPPKPQPTPEELAAREAAKRKAQRERNERRRARHRDYDRNRRERCPIAACAKVSAYRARKRGAEGSWTKGDIEALSIKQGGECAYCHAPWEHVDHMTPLVRGGSNRPANLQLLCEHHNTSKGRMTDEEYRALHNITP